MLAQLLPHYQTECSHVLPPPPLYRGELLPPLFSSPIPGSRPPPPPRAGPRRQRGWPESETGTWSRNHPCVFCGQSSNCLPVSVVFQGIEDFLGIWVDKIGPCLPQWMDNIVDETDLTSDHVVEKHQWKKTNLWLFDGGVVPIAHGADIKAGLPLLVSLLEELLHDPPNPHLVALQWFGWVGKVSTVDHVL